MTKKSQTLEDLITVRLPAEWHEDDGDVLWWKFPITEPPAVGSPLNVGWDEEYYTHWSPLPVVWAGDGQPLRIQSTIDPDSNSI